MSETLQVTLAAYVRSGHLRRSERCRAANMFFARSNGTSSTDLQRDNTRAASIATLASALQSSSPGVPDLGSRVLQAFAEAVSLSSITGTVSRFHHHEHKMTWRGLKAALVLPATADVFLCCV